MKTRHQCPKASDETLKAMCLRSRPGCLTPYPQQNEIQVIAGTSISFLEVSVARINLSFSLTTV
jgi:hypothetical protein